MLPTLQARRNNSATIDGCVESGTVLVHADRASPATTTAAVVSVPATPPATTAATTAAPTTAAPTAAPSAVALTEAPTPAPTARFYCDPRWHHPSTTPVPP